MACPACPYTEPLQKSKEGDLVYGWMLYKNQHIKRLRATLNNLTQSLSKPHDKIRPALTLSYKIGNNLTQSLSMPPARGGLPLH